MADQQKPRQRTLFPSRDSLEEVYMEARAMLPIEDNNQLISLLHMHSNTILNLVHRHEVQNASMGR